MHKRVTTRELYDQGVVANLAYHDPEKLKSMIPAKELDMDKLPAMLRIPKKKDHG